MILKIVIVTLIILLVIVLFISKWENNHYIIKKYEIDTKLDKPVTFAFLSDFHCKEYGRNNERIIKELKDNNVDFICIGGDLLIGEKNASYKNAVNLLKGITKYWTVYYAYGNHEGRLERHEEKYGTKMKEYLRDIYEAIGDNKANIYFLKDKSVTLSQQNIIISGIDIDDEYYKKFRKQNMPEKYLEDKIGNPDNNAYNILLAHHPKYFNVYRKYGSDLVLSGHYHGGAVRIPGIGGIISTDGRIFPKNDRGIYKSDKTTMIVSGGLGGHTINIRVFNRPELVIVNLKNRC